MTHKQKLTIIRRGETAAKRLSRMGLQYALGGARIAGGKIAAPWAKFIKWTDCSGLAFYLLDVMNIEYPSDIIMSTAGLVTLGVEGESDYFTMYIKHPDSTTEGHVIMRFRKRPKPWHLGIPRYRWVECGGSDNPKPGGGPTYFIPGRGMGLTWKQRIAEFPYHRCFPGL